MSEPVGAESPTTPPGGTPAAGPAGDGRVVLVLGTGPQDSATVAALRLAEASIQRGRAVAVYAYGDGVRVAADGCPTSSYVRSLLDAGQGMAAWIVDGVDPRTSPQIPGVVLGDGSDLWRLVRENDVVLGVSA